MGHKQWNPATAWKLWCWCCHDQWPEPWHLTRPTIMADWQWWMLGYKVLGLRSMIMVHKDRRIEFRSQGSSRAEVKLSKKWILRTLNIYNWWRLVSISVFKVHISTKLAISVSYPAILLQHIIFSVCLIIFTSYCSGCDSHGRWLRVRVWRWWWWWWWYRDNVR